MLDQKTVKYLIKFLTFLLLIISTYYLVIFFLLAIKRIFYPFELWHYEGNTLIQVTRIIEGKKIYVQPTFYYIPMIYGPIYYYVSALLAKIFGIHLYVFRFVSFLATLGTMYTLFLFIKKETNKLTISVIGIGLFAATYLKTGTILDSARVDSLYIFLLIASLYFSRFGTRTKSHIFAAVIMFLAIMTKQTAVLILPFIFIYYSLIGRKFLFAYLCTIITIAIGASFTLEIVHNKWYLYYIYFLIKNHFFDINNFIAFLSFDTIYIVISIFFSALYLRFLFIKKQKYGLFYTLVFAGMLLISCLGKLNIGGANNTVIPLYIIVALGFSLGLDHILNTLINKKTCESWLLLLIFSASLLQFILFLYNPVSVIPDKKTTKSTAQIVSIIKKQPHELFIPSNTYLQILAGKPAHAEMHMLNELLGGFGDKNPNKEGIAITNQIKHKIRTQSFDMIIFEKSDFQHYYFMILKDLINTYYKYDGQVYLIWKDTSSVPMYIFTKK